jgi:hypothetical protein
MIPTNYNDWKYCIEVQCAIPLTSHFIQERITALTNPNDTHTINFTSTYGEAYLQQVIEWYKKAQITIKN